MPPLHESSTPLPESSRTSGDSHNSSSAFSRNTSTTSSQASSLLPTIKCVLVGDSGVGKTSLITSYSRGDESLDFGPYIPTTFDNYAGEISRFFYFIFILSIFGFQLLAEIRLVILLRLLKAWA